MGRVGTEDKPRANFLVHSNWMIPMTHATKLWMLALLMAGLLSLLPVVYAGWQDQQPPNKKAANGSQAEKKKKERGKTIIPPGVDVIRNVEYGRGGDTRLALDIYRPKVLPKERLPAVIFIHGGGWRNGDKADGRFATRTAMIADAGYFAVSINYRLTRSNITAEVEDCKCAVRWLRANAAKYNVDPERIGVWGSSAGGHLALMVAYADEKAGLEGKGGHDGVSSAVQAVCSWYGPTELGSFGLGGREEEQKRLSPMTYVRKDVPPALLIHGEKDQTVPVSHSERLELLLQNSGAEVTFIRVKNANHGLKPVDAPAIEPSLAQLHEATVKFFDKHLKSR